MYPNDGFRERGRHECLSLPATEPIGRIVHTRRALPAIVPVNFGLDGDGAVLLRTSAASEPDRAVDGAVVAFEPDSVDVAAHSGWSVVVRRGPARPERNHQADPTEGSSCRQASNNLTLLIP
ncbi:pyridoxamine 5'-phosphate oxidase family protein [Streptomyces hygroscopicus]|uniref:pyridoxamine 5'-phosphate oxidase family protein n=1 Tax=Streptomyces hygroscopicus TaxID=1912 RepID=UPI00223F8B84|nr:pyridoxamine 5'-phosphate oxidase family protein [Streptomyces hygroscopicus]